MRWWRAGCARLHLPLPLSSMPLPYPYTHLPVYSLPLPTLPVSLCNSLLFLSLSTHPCSLLSFSTLTILSLPLPTHFLLSHILLSIDTPCLSLYTFSCPSLLLTCSSLFFPIPTYSFLFLPYPYTHLLYTQFHIGILFPDPPFYARTLGSVCGGKPKLRQPPRWVTHPRRTEEAPAALNLSTCPFT